MRNMLPHPQEHRSASCGTCFHNLRSSALKGKIFTTYYLLPITCYLLPITFYLLPMKKETIKYIIQLIVAILTAILTTLGVESCL